MLEIKLLPNSEVEIIGEISAEIFMSGKNQAVKEFSEKVEMDGFRKGKIPEEIMIKKIRDRSCFGKNGHYRAGKRISENNKRT